MSRPWIQLTLGGHSFKPTPTPEALRIANALRRMGLWVELEEELRDEDRVLVGWMDIYLPSLKLYIEVDGHHHRSDADQVWRDSYKEAVCAQRGCHVMRVPNWDAARLSVFALTEKLKGIIVLYMRLRGLTWSQALLGPSACCIPANDNQ